MRAPGYCEQAVVPLSLAFAFLLDLKNADDTTGQHDARESRRIVDHHDVEWIAIIGKAPSSPGDYPRRPSLGPAPILDGPQYGKRRYMVTPF